MLKNHYLTHFIFGGACLNRSRTLRFLSTMRTILINIFIYTLFFSVFYPPNATCAVMNTRQTCLAVPSQVRQPITHQ